MGRLTHKQPANHLTALPLLPDFLPLFFLTHKTVTTLVMLSVWKFFEFALMLEWWYLTTECLGWWLFFLITLSISYYLLASTFALKYELPFWVIRVFSVIASSTAKVFNILQFCYHVYKYEFPFTWFSIRWLPMSEDLYTSPILDQSQLLHLWIMYPPSYFPFQRFWFNMLDISILSLHIS